VRCAVSRPVRLDADGAAMRSLTDAINADFEHFCRRHRQRRPERILAEISDRHPDDARLAHLVLEARHDDVAARVLVQRLVPALVVIAARRARRGLAEPRSAFDELIATSWVLVRTYPLERRPVRILANLVCDAEYETWTREARRVRNHREVAGALEDRPAVAAPHPGEQLLDVLARARRAGVPVETINLLGRLHLGAGGPEQVAAEDGCTSRTIRTRRRAAERRLAELAAAGALDE